MRLLVRSNMPELPEVETTCRGIAPHLVNRSIKAIHVHQPKLRWPVPRELSDLVGKKINSVDRRGKYILLKATNATAIIHLGMSGSLRLSLKSEARKKHDHVEFDLSSKYTLRYHDPRRFGCVLLTYDPVEHHPLLEKLGPEPLLDQFDGEHLFALSRKKKIAVKNFVMDSHVVVGVGNIYASESLYLTGIRPGRACNRVTRQEYAALASNIRRVLEHAINMGGTTLRDFVNSDGNPGYFKQQLNVYGREGEACSTCGSAIKVKTIGQRSSFYCAQCQR